MLQMHLMQKCIFATRTFSKGKCSAYIVQRKMFSVHFPKENVQQNKMLQMHLMRCKNAFDAKMLCFLLCKKQRCVHFVTQNVTNAFDALQKYIFASHFVTQNVTNAFWRTFSKGKCSAVQKCI